MIISYLKILFAILYTAFVATLELIITPFHRTGKLFHALAKMWGRVILKVCGVKIKIEGLENLDFARSYIYVSNHASQFDIPAVIAAIPDQIRIVYKKELEKIPIFGWGLKYGKTYIGIDRGRGQNAVQSLEDAANKIRNGASVLLFGEGTRSPDGKLQQFKRGPFNLAMRAGVPIVPVAINGSYKILPKHSFRIRPGTITLVISSPVIPQEISGRETELLLRDQVRSVIERNLRE
ncbi:MAG: 1-acyl-sn-glycerol-3-phosphate acyltransferase [Ignavibacteriales bacterium]|nr:1-acyl-sn-glycerol-3-phosphate acyltransferase [Ignavibacteriales bacterium]